MTTMQELVDRYEAVKADCSKQYKDVLIDRVKGLLDAHPNVSMIQWTQYTPYFNDGEPCVFGLHGIYYFRQGENPEEMEEGHYVSSYGDRPTGLIEGDIYDLENQLESSLVFLQEAIGDHVEVSITRDGITVEEYSHD